MLALNIELRKDIISAPFYLMNYYNKKGMSKMKITEV